MRAQGARFKVGERKSSRERHLRCGRNGDDADYRSRFVLRMFTRPTRRESQKVSGGREFAYGIASPPCHIRRERTGAGENRGNLPGNRRPVRSGLYRLFGAECSISRTGRRNYETRSCVRFAVGRDVGTHNTKCEVKGEGS